MIESTDKYSSQTVNQAFKGVKANVEKCRHIAFVLQEHFSMMAFTASVDALVTANLMYSAPLFTYQTCGLSPESVKSDLGIRISTDKNLAQLLTEDRSPIDVVIVCGGFRCALYEDPSLSRWLRKLASRGVVLGGLWNGVIPLAHAGVIGEHHCALHPDNQAFFIETFPNLPLSTDSFRVDEVRMSCAGHISALEMMLHWLGQQTDHKVVTAVRDILNCDNSSTWQSINPRLPPGLQQIISLMRTSVEQPLNMAALAKHVSLSRRQMERLFREHLHCSPGEYYLETRLTTARRLLQQGNRSMTDIALACGFSSISHFSRSYKACFGLTPTQARRQYQP